MSLNTYKILYVYPILEEGPGLDFDGKPRNISFSTSRSTNVQLRVYVDNIALEPDEIFAAVLSPVSPINITGEGVFFIDTACITIRDGDGECTIIERIIITAIYNNKIVPCHHFNKHRI